jgi:DNA-binding Xre family transcriptional regulator
MTKLRRDEPVAMIVLEKICGAIDADFGDIVQFVSEDSKG